MKHFLFALLTTIILAAATVQAEEASMTTDSNEDHLIILWTSGEKDVFTKMVHPYILNSKKQGWWKEVTLIVWGPSSKLLSADEELQNKVRQLAETGVHLTACKWCADQYEVAGRLAKLGIDVKYMGKPLTEFLKSDAKVMTF